MSNPHPVSRFPKGASPNPNGYSKERRARRALMGEFQRALAGGAYEAYLTKLHEIALGDDARAALEAIRIIFEQIEGKPPTQAFEGDYDQARAAAAQMSDEEIAQAMWRALPPGIRARLVAQGDNHDD